MTEQTTSRGLLSRVFNAVDLTRRILVNLILVAVVVFLLIWVVITGGPDVPATAALVIQPQGTIVEQLSGTSMDRALARVLGRSEPQTLLQDLLDAIEAAKGDGRIQAIFLDLNSMGGAGLTKLQTLGQSLRSFRETGKKVIASADSYEQSPYYLAAMADEIYLHYMGVVLLDGYGRYRTYYKNGLDRLELDWNVFRVGEYKSAVEPYLRDNMSAAAKEANLDWLGDLWDGYLQDVADARGIRVDKLAETANHFDDLLSRTGGDMARASVEAGLVDRIASRDMVRSRMIELVGEDEESRSFRGIGFEDYLEAVEGRRFREPSGDQRIAVIVAKGTIMDGNQPPGNIGGDSTAALIRQARNDDNVKALVLRVDSGGGSAFASEVIRREFALARAAGKPVVVSMGSVAASGGYWIATASDEIWANPNTITGSIGIFAMFPTFQRTMSTFLGVHVDGVGTTPLSGALRPDREIQPAVANLIQMYINRGYRDFLSRVSEATGLTVDVVDEVARGRVWSGRDAHTLGLVTHLGGLEEATASAARLAGIEDDFSVWRVEKELGWESRVLANLLAAVSGWLGETESRSTDRSPAAVLRRMLEREWTTLKQFNDPMGVYAHCLCEVD